MASSSPTRCGEIRGQLNNYPEGCFVAVLDDKLVGYCASMRIAGDKALKPHTWDEITGNGYGSRHDPTGDFLYGYEMCVDPKVRGTRIGRRLYEERRKLAEQLELKGIVFGGRMPNLKRFWRRVDSPQDYLEQVIAGKLHDPVLRFQLANGFEPLGILHELPARRRPLARQCGAHGLAQSLRRPGRKPASSACRAASKACASPPASCRPAR